MYNMQKYLKICKNIQKYANVFEKIQKFFLNKKDAKTFFNIANNLQISLKKYKLLKCKISKNMQKYSKICKCV